MENHAQEGGVGTLTPTMRSLRGRYLRNICFYSQIMYTVNSAAEYDFIGLVDIRVHAPCLELFRLFPAQSMKHDFRVWNAFLSARVIHIHPHGEVMLIGLCKLFRGGDTACPANPFVNPLTYKGFLIGSNFPLFFLS